jgi:hypothetical protein
MASGDGLLPPPTSPGHVDSMPHLVASPNYADLTIGYRFRWLLDT